MGENRWIASIETDSAVERIASRSDVDSVEELGALGICLVEGPIGKHRLEHLAGVGRVEKDSKGTYCAA